MEKFIEAVMRSLTAASDAPLSEEYAAFLRAKVSFYASQLRTPDHPSYSWMIERAIQELSEAEGSSEESISEFIKKENSDLPWAHFTMLKHHLERLCQSCHLVLTSGTRYMLANSVSSQKVSTKNRKKSGKRKRGWPKGRRRLCRDVEDKDIATSEVIDDEEESFRHPNQVDDDIGLIFTQQMDSTDVKGQISMGHQEEKRVAEGRVLEFQTGQHKTEQELLLQGPEGAKEPLGVCGRRCPKSSTPANAISHSISLSSDDSDEDQQDHDYTLKPPSSGRFLSKRRAGRPPKCEGEASTRPKAKSSFKHEPIFEREISFANTTSYRGLGRPRFTDKRYF